VVSRHANGAIGFPDAELHWNAQMYWELAPSQAAGLHMCMRPLARSRRDMPSGRRRRPSHFGQACSPSLLVKPLRPSQTRSAATRENKAANVAACFFPVLDFLLFELAGNAAERGVEVGAESANCHNDGNRDASCDQAVFDRSCSGLIFAKPNKMSIQVGLLPFIPSTRRRSMRKRKFQFCKFIGELM
jgi:hypothetical protein